MTFRPVAPQKARLRMNEPANGACADLRQMGDRKPGVAQRELTRHPVGNVRRTRLIDGAGICCILTGHDHPFVDSDVTLTAFQSSLAGVARSAMTPTGSILVRRPNVVGRPSSDGEAVKDRQRSAVTHGRAGSAAITAANTHCSSNVHTETLLWPVPASAAIRRTNGKSTGLWVLFLGK